MFFPAFKFTLFLSPSLSSPSSRAKKNKCLSNYALCAFANCTVSFKSKGVPVAECGCLPVRGGQNIQVSI